MKLNIGFIGFGKSTTRYHLPYLLIRENINVKKIFNRKRKLELEENYKNTNIEFTENIIDILNDEDIKLVSICTPPNSHYNFSKLCLENGKNVLVEKPFCTNLKEAEELFELANQKELTIMAYQNRRFDSDLLVTKDILESGNLGKIIEIESHMDYYRPDNSLNKGQNYDGMLYGIGVHTIDQMISLFGKPKKVYYDIRSIRNSENPDDFYEIILYYNDFSVKIKSSILVKSENPRFIVHGTKGSFIKYGIDQQETFLKAGLMPETKDFGKDEEKSYGKVNYINNLDQEIELSIKTPIGDYGKIYDNLYEVIINGKEKIISDEETLIVMKILENGFIGENPKIVDL